MSLHFLTLLFFLSLISCKNQTFYSTPTQPVEENKDDDLTKDKDDKDILDKISDSDWKKKILDSDIFKDDERKDNLDSLIVKDEKETQDDFLKYEPTLAIRKSSCLACHAQVKGNFVTDFGYGTQSRKKLESNSQQAFVGSMSFRADAWSSLRLDGTLFVPKADLDLKIQRDSYPNVIGNFSFIEALRRPFINPELGDGKALAAIPHVGQPLNNDHGYVKDITAKKILIFPPTKDEINMIAARNSLKKISPNNSSVKIFSKASTLPSWAQIKSNSKGSFVLVEGNINCEEDYVIEGVLVLKNTSVAGICRIYASNSIFLVGNLVSNKILQLASGEAIIHGIKNIEGRTGINSAEIVKQRNLVNELLEDAGPFYELRKTPYGAVIALTQEPVENNVKKSKSVWQFYPNQNLDNLNCETRQNYDPLKHNCVVVRTALNRKSADIAGVLLAAPLVHSRYLGSVKGSIVANDSLFALNNFRLIYDPKISDNPILPFLNRRILRISEN